MKLLLANLEPTDVSFRGEADVDRAAEFAASVANDPQQTSRRTTSKKNRYTSRC